MESDQLIIQYDELPVSVNEYLKPSAKIIKGKPTIHMYETKKSKDWKQRFRSYLSREVKKQGWDIEPTKRGHWTLDCVFIQQRTNADNNNYYKILCDSLKGIAMDDDKNLLVKTQKVLYDSKNPRFMAVLRPVDYIGIFRNRKDEDNFIKHNCSLCRKNKDTCSFLRKAREGRIQEEIYQSGNDKICNKIKA